MDTEKIHQQELKEDKATRAQYAVALRESEERLRTLLNAMPDVVCFKDEEGRWLVANDAWIRLYQIQAIDYRGKRDSEIGELVSFYQASLASNETADAETWRRGTPSHEEQTIPCLDASPRVFDMLRVPLFHNDGRRKGLLVLGRDITRRKALEEEALRTRKLDSLAILAGGIAHDFNNILTAILGNISLAKIMVEPDGQVHDWLGRAEAASIKARELVDQLLAFARAGSPIKRPISLGALLRESASFILRGSNVRCIYDLPPDLWPVEVDEGQLGQVLHNIIRNADQAMPEGGIVEIEASNVEIDSGKQAFLPPGRYVQLAIRDQGVGIDRRHLEKIFDPYFSTKQKGCGLGLAISYSIVKNHQGTITVDSELGVGTTLTVTLPAAEEPLAPPLPALPEPRTGGGRILVMEDEAMVRQVASDMLATLGYRADFVEEGGEATKLFRTALLAGQPYAAVILDLTVAKGMGARQTIRLLRELDPRVKAIVATGYSSAPILALHRDHGFVGAITKPYNLEQLGALLADIAGPPVRRGE